MRFGLLPALGLLLLPACGYHRLDRTVKTSPWHQKGDTVRIASFRNQTPRMGVDEVFRKALENRIVAASPWRLVPEGESARWVIQASIEHYEAKPVGLSLGSSGAKGSAGSASRIEVRVVASVKLLDGQTGAVAVARPRLTFSNQYRIDQNFASFDNRELQVLDTMADDFAESFMTQLLEGSE